LTLRRHPLALFAAAAIAACDGGESTPPHPTDVLSFPLSVTADPERELVWVVSGNHDLRWRGGAVLAIDARTHAFRPELAFEVGSFPGPFVLHQPARADAPASGYIASRTSDALTHVRFGQAEDGAPTVSCGDAVRADGILRCPQDDVPSTAPGPDGGAELTLGDDPYELAVMPSRSPAQPDLLLSASIRSGTLATWALDADGAPTLAGNLSLPPTLFGLAADPTRGRVYATWRSLPTVQPLTVEDRGAAPSADARNPWLTPGPALALADYLATLGSSRDRSRAAVVSPDGARLYVSWRSPDALVVVDARAQGGNGLREIRKVVVAGDPGALAVLPARDGRPELVAVACFDAARVELVDPEAGVVVATIRVPRGPSGLAVLDKPGLQRLYAASFHENSVAVIELDPASPDYLSVLATVGGAP
jgi:hypothetical protein